MTPHRITPVPLAPRSGSGQPNSSHPPHAYGGDARCVSCKVLKTAGRGVLARWARRPRSTGPDEVHALLGMISGSVHEAWLNETPQVDKRINSAFGRRLLELLRHEIVEGWRDGGAPDSELLPLLVAIERVRVAIEPSWAQTFAQHLSGSDGLALLMDVAHDLRSPLTSILVLAETLQRGQSGAVNDVQRRQLGLIYTAALGLSSVASDIIEFTQGGDQLAETLQRGQSGAVNDVQRRQLGLIYTAALGLSSVASDIIEFTQGGDQLVEQEPSPFSITAMLESVRDIVRPIAEEKHLTVRLLAPTHDQRMGHSVALSRVLLNLTTNALKFTDDGYVEIVAQEIGGEGSNRIEFAVRDSGQI